MTTDSAATGSLVIHSARLIEHGAEVADSWVPVSYTHLTLPTKA